MTARERPQAPYAPQFYPDGVLHTFVVEPWRAGILWRIDYQCPDCGKTHRHGGGDGDKPFMGDGLWLSDCSNAPEFAPLVRLVLPKGWKP